MLYVHDNTYIIVVTIIPNFALFSYFTDRFHNQKIVQSKSSPIAENFQASNPD